MLADPFSRSKGDNDAWLLKWLIKYKSRLPHLLCYSFSLTKINHSCRSDMFLTDLVTKSITCSCHVQSSYSLERNCYYSNFNVVLYLIPGQRSYYAK